MSFKVNKLTSLNPGDWKTISWKILHCSTIDGNNNKFFAIELQNKNNEYRIFTNYGRAGVLGAIEERTLSNGSYSTSLSEVQKEFDSLIKKKQRGKKREDGSFEKYVEIETPSPTVGSDNIRGQVNQIIKTNISGVSLKTTDNIVKEVFNIFVKENIHTIKTNSSLTFSVTGQVSTALGPVTLDHISKAEFFLKQILDLNKQNVLNFNNPKARELNNEYLSLIPHSFGRKIHQEDMILSDQKILDEFELLDNLKASITVNEKHEDIENLGFEIKQVNKDDFIKLKKWIDLTRHGYNEWNVYRIFEIKNLKERKRFEESKGYNCKDVFHGTKNGNILSLLVNGFIVPPSTASHVTGRMFGDGIYGADKIRKSINYCTGFWGGKRNTYPNIFVFGVEFAMNKIYETTRALYSGVPRGYNSIFAKGGADLINNEYIVPKVEQATMKYLFEFKK